MDNDPNYNNPFIYMLGGGGILFVLAVALSWFPVWLGATIMATLFGALVGFMLWAGVNGHLDG